MAEGIVTEIELDGSVDPHFHGRNPSADGDGRMELVIESAAGEHEVLIFMGNTSPPLLAQADVDTYLPKARRALPQNADIDLYCAPLLTDATRVETVCEMRSHVPRTSICLKGFLAGVSNDGGHSVSDIAKLGPVLRACYDDSVDAPPLPIHWHLEMKFDSAGQVIEMRDREWYAVQHAFMDILHEAPEGRHVVKHVSDMRTLNRIDELRSKGYDVWGEISSHYFANNHESLYDDPRGGTAFNADKICWPIFKARPSQEALCATALRGLPYYFFGSDCAWHIDDPTKEGGVKITCNGIVCGGLAILPALSKSIVIDLFVNASKAHLLNGFLSGNARASLGLPPARTKAIYRLDEWTVPLAFPGIGKDGTSFNVRPFMRGETVRWKRVE